MKNEQNGKVLKISELMDLSGVQFGTSGVRGLVSDMTDEICYAYAAGFILYLQQAGHLPEGSNIGVSGDLRNSSARIIKAVAAAISDLGFLPVDCGYVPTPALALYGIEFSMPTIMVTGSHIPEDRNGIKFNKKEGEILKNDEQGMKMQSVTIPANRFSPEGVLLGDVALMDRRKETFQNYLNRYLEFFPEQCLNGMKVGLYEQSSVARDCLREILRGLGAEVISLGRSDTFVSVDTEAIRPEDVTLALDWAKQYSLDSIISTDGDGDRPLVSDENGVWLRGDVAGIMCASYLGAEIVVTPVSCNSAVEKCGLFQKVIRTRIGSPYVIEAMDQYRDQAVVGYEANGGFLQGSPIERDGRLLSPLPTRDSAIVPLTLLLLAREKHLPLSRLMKTLPERYTASDRLKQFPTEVSRTMLARLSTGNWDKDRAEIERLFGKIAGVPGSTDDTDGVRIAFINKEIIHLRPSGNAPELRCYNEASSMDRAVEMNQACLKVIDKWR